MAYDPKDPADKKIVDGLIADAVAEALAEQQEQHETEIAGLKAKRTELLEKLRKARAEGGHSGDENDAKEIERLEGELASVKQELKTAQKTLKDVTKERDELKPLLEAEQRYSRETLIDNKLTEELNTAKVKPELMPAVKALLEKQVTVKTDGDTRSAVVGDKSLGDFIKAWALSDQGKHYIAAPDSGGGADGSQGGGSIAGKKFSELNDAERTALHRDNPDEFRRLQQAG